MSEVELATIKAYLEGIKEDISNLKVGYREVTKAIAKLAIIEDRFQGNDESHRLLWDKLNKTSEKIQVCSEKYLTFENVVETVKDWKRNINKIWVAVAVLVIIEASRIVFTLGLKH